MNLGTIVGIYLFLEECTERWKTLCEEIQALNKGDLATTISSEYWFNNSCTSIWEPISEERTTYRTGGLAERPPKMSTHATRSGILYLLPSDLKFTVDARYSNSPLRKHSLSLTTI